ncbi:DUF1430 domain-containing protein [Shouchella clausii]|uniref:DUF1430 domain-containing protein n=1 Tax=Shouchella clausii TaxID=79880 RepID=A0A268NYW4_SHOCL|nr:DUF1430 domain-containing protein [Shouchella clausii]PAE88706.1 hypothetical protein CHH72_10020 [Shouchella clausii]
MKRLFLVFLAASFAFSTYVSYLLETDQEVRSWSAAAYAGFSFTIPHSELFGPYEVLPLLTEAAVDHNVNLLRDVQLLEEDNNIAFTTFVFLTRNSSFLGGIPLQAGSHLTIEETKDSNFILHSHRVPQDEESIKGTIQTLGRSHTRIVQPLHHFPDYVSPFGTYHVEQTDSVSEEQFLKTLVDLFNGYLENHIAEPVPLTADDFAVQTDQTPVSTTFDPTYVQTLAWTLWGITGLVLMFYIMRNGKTVAIYSMHGFSLVQIWKALVGRVSMLLFFVCIVLLPIVATCLFGWQPRYLIVTFLAVTIPYVLVLGLSWLFVYSISRSKLIDGIKNNSNTKLFLLVSQAAKAVALVAALAFLLQISDRITELEEVRHSLTDWDISKDYGEFYPHLEGYDSDEYERGTGIERTSNIITEKLYPVLNADGAIYIDTDSYQEDTLIFDAQHNPDMIRSIRVNPNYLRMFPVVDEHQQTVVIDEEETDRVLLVPHQYKGKEDEIVSYFKEVYASWLTIERYQSEQFSHLHEQDFHIVWLADQQSVFSFNIDVFPEENNMIIDPIIEVVTENNSYPLDRDFFRGSIGNDPLKVKLLDQSTAKTYEHYLPLLRDLQLEDNAKHLVTINEQAQKDISEIQRALTLDTILFVLTATIALFMIVQTSHLLFAQHKKRFLLRRFFGHSLLRAYRNVLFWTLTTWIVILSTALYRYSGYQDLTIITLALFLAEVVVTLVVLTRLEQKNKVSILKGE